MKKIAILGEGAWGTALATVLAHNGHQVQLWCHEAGVAHTIEKKRCNERYLPKISLSKNIIPLDNIEEAVDGASVIVEAIPVAFLRAVITQVKPYSTSKIPWLVTSKGIEQKTALVPSKIIADLIGADSIAVLAGPSFARDVAEQQITQVSLAAKNKKLSAAIKKLFTTDCFLVQETTDINGVQVCSAVKNVIAIAIGLIQGAGYKENTSAFVIMQGMQEMQIIVEHYGGKKETCWGLSGIADVMMTALSGQSRNRECGRLFAAGNPLEKVCKEVSGVIEGLNTLQALVQIFKKEKQKMPFIFGLYEVLYKKKPVIDFLNMIK
jgi:glycerol-3-phosphate dehydrogenase (NAD(P)+)